MRPAHGKTKLTLQFATKGKPWRTLKTITTKSDGSWTYAGTNAHNRVWRVQWTDGGGQAFTGSTTKAYKKP